MSPKYLVATMALFLATSCAAAQPPASTHAGFWHMVSDEDNGPLDDVFELRANGAYVAYDANCSVLATLGYHVFSGNIYVTNVIPGKGPVAIVYHPETDGRLSYTSPRTRNRAWYEKLASAGCVPRS